MAEKTATTTSASTGEKPEVQRTEELVQYGGKFDPAEYVPPDSKIDKDDEQWLITVIRTSENAQQLFLDDKIDEDQLAKAVGRFGKPANPSEVINRPDASYRKKLPKWVFSAPEGLGLPIDERLKKADEKNPYNPDAPMNMEQRALYPEQAKEWDEKHPKEVKAREEQMTASDMGTNK